MKYNLDIVKCSVLYPEIRIVKQVRNLFLVVERDYTVTGHLKCNVVYSAFCLSQRQLTLVMSCYLCILSVSI